MTKVQKLLYDKICMCTKLQSVVARRDTIVANYRKVHQSCLTPYSLCRSGPSKRCYHFVILPILALMEFEILMSKGKFPWKEHLSSFFSLTPIPDYTHILVAKQTEIGFQTEYCAPNIPHSVPWYKTLMGCIKYNMVGPKTNHHYSTNFTDCTSTCICIHLSATVCKCALDCITQYVK